MRRKVYTIIVSPPNLKPVTKFNIHRITLWFLSVTFLVAFVALVTYGILGSKKFYEEKQVYAEYTQLKAENVELKKANQVLAQIRQKEELIRKFLGLNVENPEEPGQGGPGLNSLGSGDFGLDKTESSTVDSPLALKNADLSACQKAVLLDRDLQEIIDFLENQKAALACLPTISPIAVSESWITSSFGWRKSPFTGQREFHSGLDIFAGRGTPVIAPGDGKVLVVGRNSSLGKFIRIRHNQQYVTVYGHLLGHKVKKGQKVKRGDVIGLVGKTGNSTGYHLHYEILKDKKPINPFPCLLNWEERHLLIANNIASENE